MLVVGSYCFPYPSALYLTFWEVVILIAVFSQRCCIIECVCVCVEAVIQKRKRVSVLNCLRNGNGILFWSVLEMETGFRFRVSRKRKWVSVSECLGNENGFPFPDVFCVYVLTYHG
jgi:hypothetical protein